MADQGWDTGEIAYLADIQHPFEYKSEAQVNKTETENLFYNFLSSYRDSDDTFYYRDLLRRQYNSGNYFVTVNLEHLSKVNEILANNIIENPTEYLPLFENAINRAVDEMTRPRPPTAPFKPLQLTISSDQNPIPIRELDAQHISKLVKVPGIVINVSSVKAKATIIFLACKNCGNTKRISLKSGFSGINFPRRCDREPIGGEEDRCPLDPYEIVGDKCTLVDQQVLKLQESPEMVPTGELPRHVLLSVDRFLTNTVMAGSRVTTVGIFDIYQNSTFKSKSDLTTRTPYIRVVGFMHDKEEDGRGHLNYSSEDETLFIALSKLPDIYERIARSISPTILGSVDIKKALACLLFGGSRKRLPDGLKLRGDINVLLLGDPGTAKSQLLKYVEKMAPVAVYTSGKGSSAAGLTASVIRDPASRDFHLEAGAMVLADGGVACIDEFDKMRESDRVAIHEAMEQQTISIAKAGITTILNSRTSVLAAANSTFGRWDDSPGPEQNIDFQATILSRFDCIFIVKDTYDEHSDSVILY
ncbi:hypothetical protein Zmor_011905 [Zophobas morio]|uniref:DNA replication licensing factor MCM5 n=1 Tax=Zophobas morio TaxID=2755281 RepID=A0AA38LZQ1_9CUCU|nr:hypothetical protein Zmor_011905 [Zophobas morio]